MAGDKGSPTTKPCLRMRLMPRLGRHAASSGVPWLSQVQSHDRPAWWRNTTPTFQMPVSCPRRRLSVIPAQTERIGKNSDYAAGKESCSTVNDIKCKRMSPQCARHHSREAFPASKKKKNFNKKHNRKKTRRSSVPPYAMQMVRDARPGPSVCSNTNTLAKTTRRKQTKHIGNKRYHRKTCCAESKAGNMAW